MTEPDAVGARAGWKKPARVLILGCGTLVLAVVAAIVVGGYAISRHPDDFRRGAALLYDSLERDLAQKMAGVPAADRSRVERSYASFRAAWLAGRVTSEDAEAVRTRLMRLAARPRIELREARAYADLLDRVSAAPPVR